ncbi:MAG: J domain-containing protein [Desulfatiglandales bacterium]
MIKLYDKITEARTLLELPEQATKKQIKANYRRLLRKWHPDSCREDKTLCQERTRAIIRAYNILADYCDNYNYSFSREEVKKYISQEEWWVERFGQGPVWNDKPPNKL